MGPDGPPTLREVLDGDMHHRGLNHLRDVQQRAMLPPRDLDQEREMDAQLAPYI